VISVEVDSILPRIGPGDKIHMDYSRVPNYEDIDVRKLNWQVFIKCTCATI
jgi:hypothetical protein